MIHPLIAQLIQARKAADLSQQALADRLDVTQTALSYWESGKRDVPFSQLVAWAEALGVSLYATSSADPPGPPPTGEDSQPDVAHELAQSLADWRENLAPLDEATRGYRAQLVADGWSAEAAEHMALSFYGTHVQMLNNAIEGAADA